MFNGDDAGNENPGALAKKLLHLKTCRFNSCRCWSKLYDALIEFKNTPVTEVMKKVVLLLIVQL